MVGTNLAAYTYTSYYMYAWQDIQIIPVIRIKEPLSIDLPVVALKPPIALESSPDSQFEAQAYVNLPVLNFPSFRQKTYRRCGDVAYLCDERFGRTRAGVVLRFMESKTLLCRAKSRHDEAKIHVIKSEPFERNQDHVSKKTVHVTFMTLFQEYNHWSMT